jgi:hypothetical protein
MQIEAGSSSFARLVVEQNGAPLDEMGEFRLIL